MERGTSGPVGTGGGAALRLFIGIDVPGDPGSRLAERAAVLAADGAELRVIDPAELHLTLAFLGNVAEEYVPAIATALEVASRDVPGPTACTTGTLRSFGAGRALGVDVHVELHAVLDHVRDRLLDAVAPYAPGADTRPWHPHVTLLRTSGRSTLVVPANEQARAFADESWIAPDLRLYASLPGPSGSLYRLVHAVPFGVRAGSS